MNLNIRTTLDPYKDVQLELLCKAAVNHHDALEKAKWWRLNKNRCSNEMMAFQIDSAGFWRRQIGYSLRIIRS